jgi:hypothetical protein
LSEPGAILRRFASRLQKRAARQFEVAIFQKWAATFRMGSEGLQTLCMVMLVAGLAFAGLGGVGSFYFGRRAATEKEIKRLTQQRDMEDKMTLVRMTNEGLLSRIMTLEEEKKAALLAAEKSKAAKAESQKQLHAHKTKSTAAEEKKLASAHPQKTKPLQLAGIQPVEKNPPPVMELLRPPAANGHAESRLSDAQRARIARILRKHPQKTITIKSAADHPESHAYAEALKRVFVGEGWHVDGVHIVTFAKAPDGLCLSTGGFPSPESLVATYEALSGAGLNVSQQLDPKLHGNQAELIVGK